MVSVIIPVYNTAQYLSRCLDSVLCQTYRDFELLLIDDGSIDDSGTICDRYAKQDSRVRVFHKENGGVSDTRNYGLDRAEGSYIVFVDSDDYIGPDYLKILTEMAVENNAEMTIISLQRVDSEDAVFIKSTDQRTVYTGYELFQEMITGKLFDSYICAKLFKAELFSAVRFPLGKTYEDLATIPYLLSSCRQCAFSTSVQYYYYHRRNSITHSPTAVNMQNWFDETERLLNYTAKEYPEVFPYAVSRLAKAVFWSVIDWYLFSRDYETVAATYRGRIVPYLKAAPSLPELTRNEKIKLTVFIHSIRLYRIIRIIWIRFSRSQDNKRYLQSRAGTLSD